MEFSGMNTKVDQFLTVSALAGWAGSISAMLVIAMNPAKPIASLAFSPLPSLHPPSTEQSSQARLPNPSGQSNLSPAFVNPEELNHRQLASGHWLDRVEPAAVSLQFTQFTQSLAPASPTLRAQHH
jgi:hypothetical protein